MNVLPVQVKVEIGNQLTNLFYSSAGSDRKKKFCIEI